MNRFTIPAAILSLLSMTACAKDVEPARVEILTPDRAQFAACLGLEVAVPANLPPYEAFKLPDGRSVVLLERVRQRDVVQSRFLVEIDNARAVCRASTAYADRWSAELSTKED